MRTQPWRKQLALITGTTVLAIGALSMLGHVLQQKWMYQWSGNYVGMAPNTSLAFFVLGVERLLVGVLGQRND